MANNSLTIHTNRFFASVLKSPIQMGWLSIINSVRNISRLGTFKRVWLEIFDFQFFSWVSLPPGPLVSHGSISNFYENLRRYSHFFVDTGNKLFISDNDTGENVSLLLLLPLINYCRCCWHRWLSLVIAGNNDTSDNLSLLTTTFIADVSDTGN